jgi:hypothetical protein
MTKSQIDEIAEQKRFRAALNAAVKHYGHGSTTLIAKNAGIRPQYISMLISEAKNVSGRESTRHKIAEVIGYDYDTFLEMGENVLHGKKIELNAKINQDNRKTQQQSN